MKKSSFVISAVLICIAVGGFIVTSTAKSGQAKKQTSGQTIAGVKVFDGSSRTQVFTKVAPPLTQPEGPIVYHGTKVVRHPDAKGDNLRIQNQIATQLSALDWMPSERKAHFSWLGRKEVEVIGWNGYIEEISPTEGGWLFKVKMRPDLHSVRGGGVPITFDSLTEIYEYTDNGFRLINTVDFEHDSHNLDIL